MGRKAQDLNETAGMPKYHMISDHADSGPGFFVA
jgi:hypothetical protein